MAEARADLGARSDDGETALHVAVQHVVGKDIGHIAALVELGADPTVCDNEGRDSFAHARVMTNRADEILAVLDPDRVPLAHSDEASNGADSEAAAVAASSMRPSHELDGVIRAACRRGQADLVRELLRLAQDAPSAAARAMVPAAAGGSVEVVETLVAARADVRSAPTDDTGNSMLIAAADEGAVRMVRWLLVQRADVTAVSNDGATALMAAAVRGSTETASALLAAQAEPDRQANGGWTALMVASQSGRTEVARLLLDAKSQLDTQNTDGATARSLAVANGHNELVKLLDTRAKLSARRAKAAKGEAAAGASIEDTRDLDDLLADLGEGPRRSARKKGAVKATAPAAECKDTAKAAADTAEPKKGKPVAPAQPTGTAEPDAAGGGGGRARSTAKKKQGGQDKDPRVQELKQQLQEIARKRAALDKEEAEVRSLLAGLGAAV